jgi:hypothetical protein
LTCSVKNNESSDAPNTISGVAIGKKIIEFVAARPLNLWRPIAKAIIVPRIVENNVAKKPILIELPRAVHTCGAPQGFNQLSKVKPFQTRFDLPPLLNEKATV